MTLNLTRHPDAGAFLARASPFLLAAEAANNLILGVAGDAARLPVWPDGDSFYFATVERGDGGEVVACALLRPPPFKLVLSAAAAGAAELFAADLAARGELPAVFGPEAAATAFADAWVARTGDAVAPGVQQRIYELERVVPPAPPPPGELRCAGAADVGLVAAWLRAFVDELGDMRDVDPQAMAQSKVAAGAVYLWHDGGPAAMAAWSGPTPSGIRVNFVYTPPERRRRGYAMAATAALSQLLLDQGYRRCFLYADLANPTSNGIYRKIGYAPVVDVVEHLFTRR